LRLSGAPAINCQNCRKGTVGFSDCTFVQWDQKKEGRHALQATGGTLLVRGCEFRENKPQIELGEGVRRAVISDNIITGETRIANRSQGKVSLSNNAPIDRMSTADRPAPGLERLILAGLLMALAGCSRPAPLPAESGVAFYVATNGNDAWTGRAAKPGRGEGPFLTITRALEAARGAQPPRKILLREGVYFLQKPLVLTPEDSGLEISAYRRKNRSSAAAEELPAGSKP